MLSLWLLVYCLFADDWSCLPLFLYKYMIVLYDDDA